MINNNPIYKLCFFSLGFGILFSCANMAVPTGGEPDVEPPKVVKIFPGQGATNVTAKKIEIIFDENVTVNNPSEKVIIAPPQKINPTIVAVNRKVSVVLRDTLLPDATYTIDFTDAIVDMNEGNPFDNFSISFSTGDVVDSLGMSGKVLMADNLEPVKGIYVGLHSNMSDTAFTNIRFERISRTNDRGEFTIRGVAPGEYKLYALDDPTREFVYKNPASTIAFPDSVIVPHTERSVRYDTIKSIVKGKVVIDTIHEVSYARLLPENITLRAFTPDFQRKYLQKHERLPNKLLYFFGSKTEMSQIELLGNEDKTDWYVLEKSRNNDSLIYWIKDKELIATDTLKIRTTYLRTDTLNQDVWKTDTLTFFDRTRKRKEKEKEKDGDEEAEIQYLGMKTNISNAWDTFKDIILEFEEPLQTDLSAVVKLMQIVDSVETAIPFDVVTDSLNPRKYFIKRKWGYGEEYVFAMDSASVHSIYGLFNRPTKTTFKIKTEDQYGKLPISLAGIPEGVPAFVELLSGNDQPVKKMHVRNNLVLFKDLPPGKYYARIILDSNDNGKWDTGNYYTGTQPETVCYYNGSFEIRANWEFYYDPSNPTWTIDLSEIAKQKPLEITKNKPTEKKTKLQMLEEQARIQQQKGAQQMQNTTNRQSTDFGAGGLSGLRP